jgi:dTDP-glucose pyrophosphorylase
MPASRESWRQGSRDCSNRPTVLIAAAGPPRPQVLSLSSQIASAAMVPVNGRPVLGWILNELARQGLNDIALLTPEGDQHIQEYVDKAHGRMRIHLYPVGDHLQPKGVADSVYRGLLELRQRDGSPVTDVLIVLGHTIVTQKLDFSARQDWVLYSEVDEEVSRWCYVTTDERDLVTDFLDKQGNERSSKALIGLYYITDAWCLLDCLDEAINKRREAIAGWYQLSTALRIYVSEKGKKIKAIRTGEWLDCGSVTGLHRSKRKLISKVAREFNAISVDEDLGVLTKRSRHPTDLYQEYAWYATIPPQLRILAPRVLRYQAGRGKRRTELQLEYYGYNSLSEVWVYQNLHEDVWKSIIKHLLTILRKFRLYSGRLHPNDFREMYWHKTERRLKELRNAAGINWGSLLTYGSIVVNGVEMRGLPSLQSAIEERTRMLYRKEDVTIIHGDFHLGNILYDVNSRLLKLIDARGNFGFGGIYGDAKYDLAKLRHSICGGYDLIVNDLFAIEHDRDRFEVRTTILPVQDAVVRFLDHQIEREGFSIEDVKTIEGLLFLSMLPLHPDHPERQLAMFLRAINILNEVFHPAPPGLPEWEKQ